MATAQTATTLYAEAANGIRYAYRRFGKAAGIPLVMHSHYRSNMDFWDPLFLNSLAAVREVIIFDQAGVGRSSGEVATTFGGWGDHVIALVKAIGLNQIDLLGFSMGGGAVQMVALKEPKLVRKLILAATFASAPGENSDVSGIVWPQASSPPEPLDVLTKAVEASETEYALAFSFFNQTEEGKAAAKAYWNRVQERNVSGDPKIMKLLNEEGTMRQYGSAGHWMTFHEENSYDKLSELKMPTLVLNGDNDALIPTSRSWELAVKIENSQLIIYPKAGHGFLYQYAKLVAAHINLFLDGFGA